MFGERATKVEITKIVEQYLHRETVLHTGESRLYRSGKGHVSAHFAVHHSSGKYVWGDVHTNTVEGFFSIFKRRIYQHCSEKHLYRHLAGFDFRYNQRVTLCERCGVS